MVEAEMNLAKLFSFAPPLQKKEALVAECCDVRGSKIGWR